MSYRCSCCRPDVLAGFFLLLMLTAGCDATGTGTVSLLEEVTFRFEFSTENREAGEEIVVSSVGQVDFDELLVEEGFTKDDVVTANVRSVSVQRVAPPGANLSAFDRVDFTLDASGLNVPILASSTSLPDGRDAELDVVVPGVTEVIWRPVFSGRLIVVPASAHDEQYVMTVTMELSIQAEGI